MDNNEKVLNVLKEATQPMRPGEIAEKAGLEKADADKAIKELKAQDKIYSPKRCFYAAK